MGASTVWPLNVTVPGMVPPGSQQQHLVSSQDHKALVQLVAQLTDKVNELRTTFMDFLQERLSLHGPERTASPEPLQKSTKRRPKVEVSRKVI
jgi:hypothetical protein